MQSVLQLTAPPVAALAVLLILGYLLWQLLPGSFLVRHCEVSEDSAVRPWSLLAAGFFHTHVLQLLRSLAILAWLYAPAVLHLGGVSFITLFVTGDLPSYSSSK